MVGEWVDVPMGDEIILKVFLWVEDDWTEEEKQMVARCKLKATLFTMVAVPQ